MVKLGGKPVDVIQATLVDHSLRTSGHLVSDLDAGFLEIEKKHGRDGAKLAFESHQWALEHVGQVSKELGIECEYR